jgi:stage V sporulation protein G
MIQNRVIAEFQAELERSKQPGYVSRYDEDYDDDIDTATYTTEEAHGAPAPHIPVPAAPPPAKTHTEPAQSHPPPPHILPVQPAGGTPSTGGPHFTQPHEREGASESKDNLPKKQPPRGEFGAGIF